MILKNKCLTTMFFLVAGTAAALAQQNSGSLLREQINENMRKDIERTLKTPAEKQAAPAPEAAVPEVPAGAGVQVNKIVVEGNTLLRPREVADIVIRYEGRVLDIEAIRRLTAELTEAYRIKGFVTSRAYLPPQTIEGGILTIQVLEGKFGGVSIRGNRYFSTSLLRKKITIREEAPFSYNEFMKSLEYMNEHPDRHVKASLVPGAKPGTTDVVLDVQERRPYHIGLGFDNWGSRELGKYRYSLKLQHNNLTGHDDRLYLGGTTTKNYEIRLKEGRYLYPLSNTLSVGANFLITNSRVSGFYEFLDKRGRGEVYGVFATKEIVREDDLQVRLTGAFDYKNVKDYNLSTLTSHDELRIVRGGVEFDWRDWYGRNIMTLESNTGIPDIMGAMDAIDPMASRAGAGGKFQKETLNYYRLQPLPKELELLLKNNSQLSHHSLVAAEQFQIGGPTSVRAYAPAERSGDSGYYSSVELTAPLYGLSKNIMVPGKKRSFYDALRLVAFYDIGYVRSKKQTPGEERSSTLRGVGCGVRLNPDNDMAIRVETGFPLANESTDGDGAHTWVEVQFQF